MSPRYEVLARPQFSHINGHPPMAGPEATNL